MEIALGLGFLVFVAALAGAALLVRRHGLAGLLYQGAAHLQAAGDAVAVAQERHRRSLAEYTDAARMATRVIQESL